MGPALTIWREGYLTSSSCWALSLPSLYWGETSMYREKVAGIWEEEYNTEFIKGMGTEKGEVSYELDVWVLSSTHLLSLKCDFFLEL